MSNPLEDPQIEISPADADALVAAGTALVVDVREPYEWDAGRVDGAVHIELENLASRAEELPTDRTIVFLCRAGVRSLMAAQAFQRAGYDARSMAGGLEAWAAAGLPLTPEGGVVADH